MTRSYVKASDELHEIAVDEFLRGNVAREGITADYDYDGGFGDDDDISDQTPEAVLGCQSFLEGEPTFLDDGSFVHHSGSLHKTKYFRFMNLTGPKRNLPPANDNNQNAKVDAA